MGPSPWEAGPPRAGRWLRGATGGEDVWNWRTRKPWFTAGFASLGGCFFWSSRPQRGTLQALGFPVSPGPWLAWWEPLRNYLSPELSAVSLYRQPVFCMVLIGSAFRALRYLWISLRAGKWGPFVIYVMFINPALHNRRQYHCLSSVCVCTLVFVFPWDTLLYLELLGGNRGMHSLRSCLTRLLLARPIPVAGPWGAPSPPCWPARRASSRQVFAVCMWGWGR